MQTEKQFISELPFQKPFETGNQLKIVCANCSCASLLRTQIHIPRHATSCIERAR